MATLQLRPYLDAVRAALDSALCIRAFPSCTVERQTRPEVEDRGTKELLLEPTTITRSDKEAVLVEPSINSVRVSVRIKAADDMEKLLVRMFCAFLMQRAERFRVLRRVPLPGWDLSFLVTHAHAEGLVKAKLVDFVVGFLEGGCGVGVGWKGVCVGTFRALTFPPLPPRRH